MNFYLLVIIISLIACSVLGDEPEDETVNKATADGCGSARVLRPFETPQSCLDDYLSDQCTLELRKLNTADNDFGGSYRKTPSIPDCPWGVYPESRLPHCAEGWAGLKCDRPVYKTHCAPGWGGEFCDQEVPREKDDGGFKADCNKFIDRYLDQLMNENFGYKLQCPHPVLYSQQEGDDVKVHKETDGDSFAAEMDDFLRENPVYESLIAESPMQLNCSDDAHFEVDLLINEKLGLKRQCENREEKPSPPVPLTYEFLKELCESNAANRESPMCRDLERQGSGFMCQPGFGGYDCHALIDDDGFDDEIYEDDEDDEEERFPDRDEAYLKQRMEEVMFCASSPYKWHILSIIEKSRTPGMHTDTVDMIRDNADIARCVNSEHRGLIEHFIRNGLTMPEPALAEEEPMSDDDIRMVREQCKKKKGSFWKKIVKGGARVGCAV